MDLPLPPIRTSADLEKASAIIIRATASGQLSADHGRALMAMLQDHRRLSEIAEFERRLAAVENMKQSGGDSGPFPAQPQAAEPSATVDHPAAAEEGTDAR